MVDTKEVFDYFQDLKNERSTLDSTASEVADFCLPDRKILSKIIPGSQQNITLYDNRGVNDAFLLASAIKSGLVSQSSDWLKLRAGNTDDSTREERIWLDNTGSRALDEYQETNFYTSAFEYFMDLVVFGTSYLYQTEFFDQRRGKDSIVFQCYPWEQCYIDVDEYGLVNTLFREYEQSNMNILRKFSGFSLPEKFKEKAMAKPNSKSKILHVIRPVKPSDNVLNPGIRFANMYFLCDGNKTVINQRRGFTPGFFEFPVAVSRFKVFPGEKYGKSPAMDALPTLKTLNKLVELDLKQAEISILPPWFYKANSFGARADQIQLIPGQGMAVRDPSQISYYQSTARHDVAKLKIEDLHGEIDRHFFVDQIQFPSLQEQGTPASATEISARTQFMNRIIEPIFGRMVYEGLDILIYRTLSLLFRRPEALGGLTPMPESLRVNRKRVDIEYKGPLERNQRIEESQAIDEMLEFIMRARQVMPELTDRFNIDAAVLERSRIRGIPEKLLYSKKEFEANKQNRIQQEQQLQQMQMMQMAADSISKTSKGQVQ